MPPTKQATIRSYTARSLRKQQLQRARESRKRNREPEIEPRESDVSRCELALAVSSVPSSISSPVSSVPSSISSPVASSSTSAAACTEHVIGASGKKFKAFHKKDESGSCELIDHPTNSDVQEPVDNTPLPTTICDLNEIANLFAACACPVCGQTAVRLQSEESRKRGMAVHLTVTCSNCDTLIGTNYTSATMPAENNSFEVTRRTVTASVLCGFAARKLNKFCEYLNLPGLSSETFKTHCDALYQLTPRLKEHVVELAVQAVREAHKDMLPNCVGDGGIIDIAVSYDGTWHTRGHSSKLGVACVIDLLTGICIDYHVMSKYCQKCETTGKKMEELGPNAYEVWFREHQPDCKKNFEGSSGMMEVEGARQLWTRSVAQHKLRYTTILSDGDCKTFSKLQNERPYGDVLVKKEECVNHVSKRMGTALRNLITDNKKRGVTLGGRGEGQLKNQTVKNLQKYYAKAIRSSQTVETMSNAVWASLFHCTSTDEDPHHARCPQGTASWCFYQRASARGEPPMAHKGNTNTPVNRKVAQQLLTVYKRLSDPELLRRCLRRRTQNANESLHGVIWSRCPKHTFASRDKVEVATLLSVGEFNMGSSASHNFMTAQGLVVGENTKRLGNQRDNVRTANSRRSVENKQQQRREKVRLARETERRRHLQAEGGPAYVPGGF